MGFHVPSRPPSCLLPAVVTSLAFVIPDFWEQCTNAVQKILHNFTPENDHRRVEHRLRREGDASVVEKNSAGHPADDCPRRADYHRAGVDVLRQPPRRRSGKPLRVQRSVYRRVDNPAMAGRPHLRLSCLRVDFLLRAGPA